MNNRVSGILLHVSSLPSQFGIGDLGPEAYRFADFLSKTKQGIWQILPINLTDVAQGNSPYQSASAFAGNPLLLSPEMMVNDGFIAQSEIEHVPSFPKDHVDYTAVIAYKTRLFKDAYKRFQHMQNRQDYEAFCTEQSDWLDDFALFMALRGHFQGKPWTEWPHDIRDRKADVLSSLKNKFRDTIESSKFLQYLFFKQWDSLKDHCNHNGVHIFGDIPIYVIHDSVDVWANPDLFMLDEEKRPSAIAGVPPDYFSETGQLWGNPIYRWDVLRESGYEWWMRRFEHNARLLDLIRIDHFRGLVGYWLVPAGETNAVNGQWVKAPAEDFFTVLLQRFPEIPIVAEDLGVITSDVIEIMDRFEFPGMKILLFAFGDDIATNPYIPHNLRKNCFIYTGTHDNNTARGWYEREASPDIKKKLFQYLGQEVCAENIHCVLVRLAMMSVAKAAIFPMQDILGLGEEARMNRPATTVNNWQWRLLPEQLTPSISDRLREMTEIYGRGF
jgi:4-alpha-glucanotransferase